ncbi:MAG: hypothetical protein ABJN36_15435 [Cyclobacteriaceae bacterium]
MSCSKTPVLTSFASKIIMHFKENDQFDHTGELDDVLDSSFFSTVQIDEEDEEDDSTMPEEYFRKITDL